MLQNPCKTLGFKKNMVYEIPPGGGGEPYPASGLRRFVKVFSHKMSMGVICYHNIQSSNSISINHTQRFTLPDDSLIKIGQLNLDLNYFEHFDRQCRRTPDVRPLPY